MRESVKSLTYFLQLAHIILSTLSDFVKRYAIVLQGPTLTFQLMEASLQTDVRRSQRRPKVGSMRDYAQAPMVVLNGFGNTSLTTLFAIHLNARGGCEEVPSSRAVWYHAEVTVP